MRPVLLILFLSSINLYGQATNGNEYYEKTQYMDAVTAYELVRPPDRDGTLLNRLGISYHMVNRPKEAEAAFKAAIRAVPQDSPAYNNLAALYYFQRKYGNAERELRRALEHNPENTILRRNLRAAKFARENSKKAIEIAGTVVADKPLLVQQRLGDLLEVVLLLPPPDVQQATLHELRGDTFFARKLFDDAIIEYRKAIGLDRYNASVANRLGLAYHQSQKVKEAEEEYRQALKLNPFYLEALNNLGSIDYSMGRFTRAMDQYRKALKIRPDSPTVLLNIGACLFAMERYDEGYLVYQRALKIDPKSFERTSSAGTLIQTTQRNESMMSFYLAKVFAGSGDTDRAISYLYKAVEEGFKDIEKIKSEPSFAVFAGDERFMKLLESLVTSS